MRAMSERCLNCESDLRGPYCHACGQRVGPRRLRLRDLVGPALKETFSADGRLARSIGPFLFRPGFLVTEYLAGRRVRYTSPLRLYLFALFTLVVAMRVNIAAHDIADYRRSFELGREL